MVGRNEIQMYKIITHDSTCIQKCTIGVNCKDICG